MNLLDFKSFQSLNEDSRDFHELKPISPVLKKQLDIMGKYFKSEKEVIDAIKLLGFEEVSPKRKIRSSEYRFKDPQRPDIVYTTYSNGYVRAVATRVSFWTKEIVSNFTPISKSYIPTPKDRLLIIFRIALKRLDLYKDYIDNADKYSDFNEFIAKKRGFLAGKKFGL